MIEIDTGVAQRFLVALLIGALVGVEREKSQSASVPAPRRAARNR